jgi:hypothetical protein
VPFPQFLQSNERDSNLISKILRDNNGSPILSTPSPFVRIITIKRVELLPSIAKKNLSWTVEPPNGTKVIMMDAQQIQYIWYDGKIVPRTNEAMLAIARGGHKFMPGPDNPRFWLVTISILMILAGLGKMLYDIIQKNKKGGA